MTTVERIKAAAAKLDPDEQYELFRWWIQSDGFRQKQLALKRDIAAGIADLENGHYQIYSQSDSMRLAEEIGQRGRKRLAN